MLFVSSYLYERSIEILKCISNNISDCFVVENDHRTIDRGNPFIHCIMLFSNSDI